MSHCETDSHRERYVDALRNATSLKIDVFGECGKENLKLPPRPEETEYGNCLRRCVGRGPRNFMFCNMKVSAIGDVT